MFCNNPDKSQNINWQHMLHYVGVSLHFVILVDILSFNTECIKVMWDPQLFINEPNRNMNPGLKILIGPWEVNKRTQPVTTTCVNHLSLARQNNINTFHTKQVKKLCLVQHKQSPKCSCDRIDCRQNTKDMHRATKPNIAQCITYTYNCSIPYEWCI